MRVQVSKLWPEPETLEIDLLQQDVNLVGHWYPRLQQMRFNYVLSATNVNPATSDEITTQLDRYFVRAIRSVSDLIVTTGVTARTEQLKGSKYAPTAIITNKPNELDIPATQENTANKVLICSAEQLTRVYPNSNLEFISIPVGDITKSISKILKQTESQSPLLESGLTVARQLMEAKMLGELCLTVVDGIAEHDALARTQDFLRALQGSGHRIQTLQSGNSFFFRFCLSLESS